MLTDVKSTASRPRGLARVVSCLVAAALSAAAVAAESSAPAAHPTAGIVVFQSDFGLKDQAVAAMRGVARTVDPHLVLENLTHEIPPFNVWEAAYRLDAVVDYWPRGTVFVSVVDPGVGTARRSVVMRSDNGLYFVTPDNGTLTLVADRLGVSALREIDESVNALPGVQSSHTFHGRDVYAYTGARLASGQITFEQVGPKLAPAVVRLSYHVAKLDGDTLEGTIPVLDPEYGNVWTNIPPALAEKLGLELGERATLGIFEGPRPVVELELPYVRTFGDVPKDAPLLYVNSVGRLAIALNQGDFAARYGIHAGPDWRVAITRQRD